MRVPMRSALLLGLLVVVPGADRLPEVRVPSLMLRRGGKDVEPDPAPAPVAPTPAPTFIGGYTNSPTAAATVNDAVFTTTLTLEAEAASFDLSAFVTSLASLLEVDSTQIAVVSAARRTVSVQLRVTTHTGAQSATVSTNINAIGTGITINGVTVAARTPSYICSDPPCGVTSPCYDQISCTFDTQTTCSTQSPPTCMYLCELYQATGGASWKSRTNWGQGSISSWYGISINDGIRLSLMSNSLVGTIPSNAGCLLTERFLVSGNTLSGTLPAMSVPNGGTFLRAYIVASNSLSGTLPSSLLDHDLEFLKFDSNRLSGTLPDRLSALAGLKWCFLNLNRFSGTTPSLTSHSTMQYLLAFTVADNSISGALPSRMPQQVNFGDMSNNRMSGSLQPWASNDILPGNAAYIFLRNNSLSSTIPPNWLPLNSEHTGHPHTRYFELNSNSLSGSLPHYLASFTTLVQFAAPDNRLSGTIDHMLPMPMLSYLILGSNPFVGHLGDTSDMSAINNLMVVLTVEQTGISGTLPVSVVSLQYLQHFIASGTRVSGHLPPPANPEIPLTQFVIDRAGLSGTIPGSIASLTGLQGFQANAMQLSGTIPQGAYPSMQTFSITKNQVRGSTGALVNALQLKSLILSSNYLSCDSVRLDGTELGTGQFYDPTALALYQFGIEAANKVNEDLTNLVEGDFAVIIQNAVQYSGFEWISNPYSNTTLAIENVVTVFSGNSELTESGCDLPRRTPSRVVQQDVVMLGTVQQFDGFHRWKSLMWIMVPALCVAHVCFVLVAGRLPACVEEVADAPDTPEMSTPRSGSGSSNARYSVATFCACNKQGFVCGMRESQSDDEPAGFIASGCFQCFSPEFHQCTVTRITSRLLIASSVTFCFAIWIAAVSATAPTIHSDGCLDYYIMLGVSHVDFKNSPKHQWLLVSAVCGIQLTAASFLVAGCLSEHHLQQRAARFLNTINTRLSSTVSRVLHAWKKNVVQTRSKKCFRNCVTKFSCLLGYIALFILMAIPEAGYIIGQNSPRTESNSWITLLTGPTLVALVKAILAAVVLPGATRKLVCFEYEQQSALDLSCIKTRAKAQLMSMIRIQFLSSLIIPPVFTFIFDENCLRSFMLLFSLLYLLFSEDLKALLDSWHIGDYGFTAYEPQKCGRSLVSLYSYVWITIVVLQFLLAPAILIATKTMKSTLVPRLAQKIETWKRKVLTPEPDDVPNLEEMDPSKVSVGQISTEQAELQACVNQEQGGLATLCITQGLLCLVFGPVCPMVLLLLPFSLLMQLRGMHFVETHIHQSFPQRVARVVLVQLPLQNIMTLFHFAFIGNFLFILQDFGFDSLVLYFYFGFSVIEVAGSVALLAYLKVPNKPSGPRIAQLSSRESVECDQNGDSNVEMLYVYQNEFVPNLEPGTSRLKDRAEL